MELVSYVNFNSIRIYSREDYIVILNNSRQDFTIIKKIYDYNVEDAIKCIPDTYSKVILDLSNTITDKYVTFIYQFLCQETKFVKFLSFDSNCSYYYKFFIDIVDNVIINVVDRHNFTKVIELLKSKKHFNKVLITFWVQDLSHLSELMDLHINELYIMSIFNLHLETLELLFGLLEKSEQFLLEFGTLTVNGNYNPLCEEYTKMISKYDDLSIFILLEKVLYGYMPTIFSFI